MASGAVVYSSWCPTHRLCRHSGVPGCVLTRAEMCSVSLGKSNDGDARESWADDSCECGNVATEGDGGTVICGTERRRGDSLDGGRLERTACTGCMLRTMNKNEGAVRQESSHE